MGGVLRLQDAEDPRASFLYELAARSQALSHFTHVVVVSSYQDQYAPFESARMEVRAGPSSRALGGGSAR